MEWRYGYIYIMTNKNNKVLYIGVTSDLPRRITEHKTGMIEGFTKKYNTHKLVYVEQYNDIETAIQREKQLKGWSHKKKVDLIERVNPDWEDIPLF